jgi:hypothetical protein
LGTTNPSSTQISFKKSSINFGPTKQSEDSSTLTSLKSLIPKKGPIKFSMANIKVKDQTDI